jgi:hypothetical protein
MKVQHIYLVFKSSNYSRRNYFLGCENVLECDWIDSLHLYFGIQVASEEKSPFLLCRSE